MNIVFYSSHQNESYIKVISIDKKNWTFNTFLVFSIIALEIFGNTLVFSAIFFSLPLLYFYLAAILSTVSVTLLAVLFANDIRGKKFTAMYLPPADRGKFYN